MNNDNFPILKNSTPSTSEKNINFINEMISNTLFNRKTDGEINLHEFSSKAKSFRSYDKFLDTNELDAEKLKEIKAFMNSVDKLEPIRDGLICWLDGRDGNNNDRTTIWKDRSGNGNDATLVGFDFNENSGWGDGCLIFKKPSDPLQLHNYVKLYSNITNLHVHVTLDRANSTLNNKTEYVFDSRINDESTSGFCILKLGSDEFIKASRNCKESFLDSSKLVGNNLPTSKTYTKAPFTISFNLTSADINPKFIGKRYMPANSNIEHIDMKLYTLLLYDRTLTTEEIRHNYLYDLSVQYLLKNQINSNTIETYYDFDPNYDLPDNRIEGCLMVSNGRLVYYNPSGSAPLRIANNKTLDECIVEETEDYIIYSDGEVTPDNPIPEGIYFACRVDKHTGEIYYGEGYENLRDMSSNYEPYNSLKILNEDWVKFTRNSKGHTYSFSSIKYTENVIHNLSLTSMGDDGRSLQGLQGNTRSNFNIIKEIYNTPSLEIVYSGKSNKTMWVEPSIIGNSAPVGYGLKVHRFQITKTEDKKPYIRSKIPKGRLAFLSDTICAKTHSFITKQYKPHIGNTNSVQHPLVTSKERYEIIDYNIDTSYDFICTENIRKTIGRSVDVSSQVYSHSSTGLMGVGHWSTKYPSRSIHGFLFFKGNLTESELRRENEKTFRLKKFYRTNSNQSSFLGLEDIFTNNNTKEIIDGTIIDTTKTPIEYKEQKDISKTSDVTSYTKNNINIEKSKCGYIRDIRNTNDFKNLPNNLVAEPSKYDEKYQSPTINILKLYENKYKFNYGYLNTTNQNTKIVNSSGIARIEALSYSDPNTLCPIYNSILPTDDSLIGYVESVSMKVRGNGLIRLFLHQVRGSDGGDTQVVREVESDGHTWSTLKIENVVINKMAQNLGFTLRAPLTWIEVKDIQVELSPVATDYTPPNSDGNFVPTIGESGIFSINQTTKDTDKNTNTFARTIFLP